ncbi:uncharacterized protein IL334_005873 [Kwoniella shivajii]|uniref:Uncharacterized protein n=1 Tax=Kwoniella shivajii TaxID=564305 RepID=A0ABZ1D4C4_9TREE|nr:hypothetical protein IL334_005873 [Kwoniella shivajii]
MTAPVDILEFSAPLQGYKNRRTDREAEFNDFFAFAGKPEIGHGNGDKSRNHAFAIQVSKQVNFGSIYSVRYFASTKLIPSSENGNFSEITQTDIIEHNLSKVNSYKNYKTRGLVKN